MIVNRNQFAELSGFSSRQVGKWIADGTPAEGTGKKGAPVRIDSAKAIKWLLDRAAGGAVRKNPSQHERLLAAKARKVELEVARIEGGQVSADEYLADMQALAVLLVEGLEALPGRCAHEVAAVQHPGEASAILKREVRSIRTALADKLAHHAKSLDKGEAA